MKITLLILIRYSSQSIIKTEKNKGLGLLMKGHWHVACSGMTAGF